MKKQIASRLTDINGLAMIITVIILVGCESESPVMQYTNDVSSKMTDTLDEFIARIDKAPAWTALDPHNGRVRCPELDALGNDFRRFSVNDARIIVKRFMSRHGGEPSITPLGSLSKVYVLLRFYFEVPEREPISEAQFFGGWLGVPEIGSDVNILWPLESKDGELRVTYAPIGYAGPDYDALGEFDFFAARYGRRTRLVNPNQ